MGEHRLSSTDLQNTNATKHGVEHPQTITFSYRHKCNYLVLLPSKESTINTQPGEPPTILRKRLRRFPYELRRFVIGGAVLPLLFLVAIILKIAYRAAHHQRLSGNGFGSPVVSFVHIPAIVNTGLPELSERMDLPVLTSDFAPQAPTSARSRLGRLSLRHRKPRRHSRISSTETGRDMRKTRLRGTIHSEQGVALSERDAAQFSLDHVLRSHY
jgi:hypothetical protein